MSDKQAQDPLADTHQLIDHETPPGVDRRSFLMRTAVGGAAAVMTGCTQVAGAENSHRPPQPRRRRPAAAAPSAPPLAEDLNVVMKSEGAGVDDRGRVLQGGPGAVELPHDRPDAHHLRFLPAGHEAARRPAGQGDQAPGEPVRQSQRDRQGARHGAGGARGSGRPRAGNRRPEIPRRPARQARPGVPGEARRASRST